MNKAIKYLVVVAGNVLLYFAYFLALWVYLFEVIGPNNLSTGGYISGFVLLFGFVIHTLFLAITCLFRLTKGKAWIEYLLAAIFVFICGSGGTAIAVLHAMDI